jgi:hypothetical protein
VLVDRRFGPSTLFSNAHVQAYMTAPSPEITLNL